MSRNYKLHNPEGVYSVSFAVIKWFDVFTRHIANEARCQLLPSLRMERSRMKQSASQQSNPIPADRLLLRTYRIAMTP